jgi:hypothetical protein
MHVVPNDTQLSVRSQVEQGNEFRPGNDKTVVLILSSNSFLKLSRKFHLNVISNAVRSEWLYKQCKLNIGEIFEIRCMKHLVCPRRVLFINNLIFYH